MTEQEQAALEVAAPEGVSQETTSEVTENTQGQDATPPAEVETPEKTASKERRERRKAHEQKLREDAARAKSEADALRQRVARMNAAKGEPPKESDFGDSIEYVATKAAYNAREMVARQEAALIDADVKAFEAQAEAAEKARQGQLLESYREQAQEAKERYADFDQVVAVAMNPTIVSQDLSLLVLESDRSADIAYHLGKNPALALQLSQMPPIMAARELGRLEAALSVPAPKTQSNAPAPINPVTGKGATAAKSPDQMSLAEFAAWRAAGGVIEKG